MTTPQNTEEPEVEGFAMDGINSLIAVTQMKASDASIAPTAPRTPTASRAVRSPKLIDDPFFFDV